MDAAVFSHYSCATFLHSVLNEQKSVKTVRRNTHCIRIYANSIVILSFTSLLWSNTGESMVYESRYTLPYNSQCWQLFIYEIMIKSLLVWNKIGNIYIDLS